MTYAHPRSRVCCALYCLWARYLLNEIDEAWQKAVEFLRDFYKRHEEKTAQLEFHIRPLDAHQIKGSGYVVDSLFSAKWASEKNSFEEVVKAAIKLGNDTDTTACIAGGIAGIKFGVNSIPIRWRENPKWADRCGSSAENLLGGEIFKPLLEKLIVKLHQ